VALPSAADRKEIPFFGDSESLILSSKTIFSFRVESLSKKTAAAADSARQGKGKHPEYRPAQLHRGYSGPQAAGRRSIFRPRGREGQASDYHYGFTALPRFEPDFGVASRRISTAAGHFVGCFADAKVSVASLRF